MTTSVLYRKLETASGHFIGEATLNSEKTLNSLTLEMIQSLSAQLDKWELDPSIAVVWLQGSGTKAFCAGGDIRKLYEQMIEAKKTGDTSFADEFFVAEYSLDYKIHTYSKPLIVWGHGIVMGGGLGLLAGASCRIVNETTKLAMPEITIGLYPDVGASWFLNQMPEGVGLYLGLTGTRLNGAETLLVGLVDYFVKSDFKEKLQADLAQAPWGSDPRANLLNLKRICASSDEICKSSRPATPLKDHLAFMAKLTRFSSVEEIEAFWQSTLSTLQTDPWILQGLETFKKGSPTSAKVTFEQIKRGKKISLRETFMMEAIMTIQFSRGHDFPEGVRALIIDKDNSPKWKPSTLESVSAAEVQKYFTSPWGSSPNPLEKLPIKEKIRC